MKRAFPAFDGKVGRRGEVIWKGTLQPTPESPVYRIRIVHSRGTAPRVFVEYPVESREAPHLYPDGSLCLYRPGEWRWNSSASLAETIVPWAALWLYYYEAWQVTGVWYGPEAPHSPTHPKESE